MSSVDMIKKIGGVRNGSPFFFRKFYMPYNEEYKEVNNMKETILCLAKGIAKTISKICKYLSIVLGIGFGMLFILLIIMLKLLFM